MRKKLIIAALLCIFGISSFAQGLNMGFTMGANFSYLVGKDRIEGSKSRIGICPGILLDIPLVYDSYLELGAIYSQQGVKVKTDEYVRAQVRVIYTEKRDIDYVMIPITWKQKYGDFITQAGPFVSIATKASLTWKADTVTREENTHTVADTAYSFVNKLRPYDVGAYFGIGYQTAISGGLDLFIMANYKLGFFSVENKTKNMYENKILRNQVFSISAGLIFMHNRGSKTYRHHSHRRR